MLCEKCKVREANIQYTEVINGVATEHNFCAQCAKDMDFGQYSAIFEGDFPLGKLLSGLLGVGAASQKKEHTQKIVCPTCKTTYDEFVKNSRFGCADCYGVFDLLISDNIKQLQGSESHTGKHPITPKLIEENEIKPDTFGEVTAKAQQSTEEEQISVLEQQLKDAVQTEDFVMAAQYRDRIKELKEGRDTNA